MISKNQLQSGLFTLMLFACAICSGNLPLWAQNSSLFQQPSSIASNQMLDLDKASWTYVPPTPSRVLKKHDIISIRVDELARSLALGTASSRKNGVYDAVLKSWVVLNGLTQAEVTPQTLGDQRITGQTNQTLRANSDMETRELLTFNIAAEVVDIKPNGVVMLEAKKTITLNDNTFETTLTGLCRSDDIGPDNVVLSRDLLDLNIDKQDRGHVRDGYKRGWFTRWLAELNPF